MHPPRRFVIGLAAGIGLAGSCLGGCVRRTIRITSQPSGALVWLNDREIGRTPLEVEFVHYGRYDVRIVKDGYEAMIGSGDAKPPVWDNVGLDLVAEILPMEFESLIEWHYDLEPKIADPDERRAALLERAHEIRRHLEDEEAADAATIDVPGGAAGSADEAPAEPVAPVAPVEPVKSP